MSLKAKLAMTGQVEHHHEHCSDCGVLDPENSWHYRGCDDAWRYWSRKALRAS